MLKSLGSAGFLDWGVSTIQVVHQQVLLVAQWRTQGWAVVFWLVPAPPPFLSLPSPLVGLSPFNSIAIDLGRVRKGGGVKGCHTHD